MTDWKEIATDLLEWKGEMLLRFDLAEDSTPTDVVKAAFAEARLRLSDAGLHDGSCPEPDSPCTCGLDTPLMKHDRWYVKAKETP